mgnify:CR=1 FL=1
MIEYSFRKLWTFTPFMQLSSITIAFVATVLLTYTEYSRDGKVFTSYDPWFGTVFAPIYEEIIFRWIIQNELTRLYGTTRSIIGTSLLFGIYHLKNIYRLSPWIQVQQILRTWCVLWPILSILAHKTKSIRTWSILHYLNNIIATIHVPL